MKSSSGLALVDEMHPEAVQLPAPGGEWCFQSGCPRCGFVFWFGVFFLFKYIYILIDTYLHGSKICVESQQAGSLGWEGVAAAGLSRGGSCPWLSPEKLHFCAEHEPRNCREAAGVCGASGRASRLLRSQAWVWAV